MLESNLLTRPDKSCQKTCAQRTEKYGSMFSAESHLTLLCYASVITKLWVPFSSSSLEYPTSTSMLTFFFDLTFFIHLMNIFECLRVIMHCLRIFVDFRVSTNSITPTGPFSVIKLKIFTN